MSEETKQDANTEVGKDTQTSVTGAVELQDNLFMDSEGRFYVPSYLTYQQTRDMSEVTRNYQLAEYPTLRASVASKKKYTSSLGYADVLENLTFGELFVLRFIGIFSSVQKLQVRRQCQLFKKRFEDHHEAVTDKHIAQILRRLEKKSLILKNNFDRIDDSGEKKITVCYTLDVEGYHYLKNYYGQSFTVNDPDVWFLWSRGTALRHLRCWECVDVYQFFQSLPAFRGFNTLFAGQSTGIPTAHGPLVCSTLQVSLKILFGQKATGIFNLVCYPCVQTDGVKFYKSVLSRWQKWLYRDESGEVTETKPNPNKPIPGLEQGYNALAFIVPDEDMANYLNSSLKLFEFKDTMILFIVLNRIQEKGALHALLLPSEQYYNQETKSYDGELKELQLKELLVDADSLLPQH